MPPSTVRRHRYMQRIAMEMSQRASYQYLAKIKELKAER
jgi:hypothetical protein